MPARAPTGVTTRTRPVRPSLARRVWAWRAGTRSRRGCSPAMVRTRCASMRRGRQGLTEERLAVAFHVTATNLLVGLGGRVQLLRRLGNALAARPDTFGPLGRPGGLFDVLAPAGAPATVHAHDILSSVLDSLSGVWLADNAIGDEPLGDC